MTATGINIHGKEIELSSTGSWLMCDNKQLVSIWIPSGKGIKYVECHNNHITHIDLPDSVTEIIADKEVTGLNRYIGTDVKINLY